MNSTIKAEQLSYNEMVLDFSGSIISREEKAVLRKQHGYCMTCQDVPVLLVEVQRSRMNPLWSSKKPRSADGECLDGKCLRCNPSIIPTASCVAVRPGPVPSMSLKSISSSSSLSSGGAPLGSNHSTPPTSVGLGRAESHLASSTSVSGSFRRSNNNNNANDSRHSVRSSGSFQTDRDTRPKPPQRSVSFDRSPYESSTAARPGSRRNAALARSTVSPLTRENDSVPCALPARHLSNYDLAATLGEQAASTRSLPARTNSEAASPLRTTVSNVNDFETRLHCDEPSHVVTSVEEGTVQTDSVNVVSSPFDNVFAPSMHVHKEKFAETEDRDVFESCKQPSEKENVLSELKSLLDGMKGEDIEFLAEILIGSMDANSDNEEVHAYCLKVMAELFQDALTESTVLLDKIVGTMNHFALSLNVQRGGCMALCALASNKNNCIALVRAKVCELVSDILSKHIGDSTLVEAAIGALRKLSINWEAREKLLNLHVSDRVAEAMQCNPTPEIQRDGCALLSNIAVDGEKRSVCVVSLEVLGAVVNSVKVNSQDGSVIQSACFALKNFTYDETNLRSLTKVSGVFEALQEGCTDNSHDCEDCFIVLERLQLARAEAESLEEQSLEMIRKLMDEAASCSSTVASIAKIMQDIEWSPKIIAHGFHALCMLAADSDHQEELQKKEVRSQLHALIEQYVVDVSVQLEARPIVELFMGTVAPVEHEPSCSEE